MVVVGGGPGGYVAAIRAAQLGMNVACVEKEAALGGTCLRIGCIPSKALLESSELYTEAKNSFNRHGINVGPVTLDLAAMLKRKDTVVKALTGGIDGLFKKNKVTRIAGTAKLTVPGRLDVQSESGTQTLQAKHIVLATGSIPASLPGIEMDYFRIGTSTEALCYETPPAHLIVIGAGYIGLELGAVWNRLGSKVTVLEYLDRILPGTDGQIAKDAQKIFEKQGIEFRLGTRVLKAYVDGEECVVECEGSAPLRSDRVLVSVGRVPASHNLGLEDVGVAVTDRGFVKVNEKFETSVPGIHAIGDLIGGAMLAHKAEEEGVACVEWIGKGYGHVNYGAIPSVCYTHPEIGAVGKTEEQLKKEGIEYKVGTFPYIGNGRARAIGAAEGMAKVLADAKTDRILGVHILGAHAGDLIAECAVAMEFHASAEDIARTSHAHPTLAEIVKEAAMAVEKRAIHC